MIKGHGNNIYQYPEGAIEHDFSSNIAFNNCSAQIIAHLAGAIDALCNYPDPEARRLTEMIAQCRGVETPRVLVTNGSAEAFYLLAQYFAAKKKTRAAIAVPSFAEYEDSCKAYGHTIEYISFAELEHSDSLELCDTLWIGVPNNPDGRRIGAQQLRRLAQQNPHCTLIVDCAYNELSGSSEQLTDLGTNTIIIDSFTKLYGIPGIRLGHLIAPQEVVQDIAAMRPPWSVNALSLIAGEYIVKNHEALQPNIKELMAQREHLQSQIAALEGFEVTPSDCNFILVKIIGSQSAAELQQHLIEEHRILIRDCSNFRTLSKQYFRVAAQGRAASDKLIKALREWR